jgi:hypothetical protein
LVRQLADRLAELPTKLEELFDDLKPKNQQPSLDQLNDILLAVSKKFSAVYIVCDALDECDQDKQRKELLPKLIQMGGSGLNLFITSRPYPEDISESFDGIGKIDLLAREEDLHAYIQEKIDTTPRARGLIRGSKYEGEIISALAEAAGGM